MNDDWLDAWAALRIGGRDASARQFCRVKIDLRRNEMKFHVDREISLDAHTGGIATVCFFDRPDDGEIIFEWALPPDARVGNSDFVSPTFTQ